MKKTQTKTKAKKQKNKRTVVSVYVQFSCINSAYLT